MSIWSAIKQAFTWKPIEVINQREYTTQEKTYMLLLKRQEDLKAGKVTPKTGPQS